MKYQTFFDNFDLEYAHAFDIVISSQKSTIIERKGSQFSQSYVRIFTTSYL